MANRTGYHADIEHGVLRQLKGNSKKSKEWKNVTFDYMEKLNEGFYEKSWVNNFIQESWHKGKFDLVDAYLFANLWTDLNTGQILVTRIDIDAEPQGDKSIHNPKILSGLNFIENQIDGSVCEITGEWRGGNDIGDGSIQWNNPLKFSKLQCHNNKHEMKEEVMCINPRKVTLEVGFTKITTSWYHLSRMGGGSLARWPYGSKEIAIFVRPEDWFRNQKSPGWPLI